MPLLVNLRHLARHDLSLKGELPVSELDLDARDEMIQPGAPLEYDLEAQKLEDNLLVRGRLTLRLDCRCVRCLKAFQYPLALTEWTRHFPLQGEESVPIVNDCVDLTPHIREDILLEFPRHPLCKPECRGLAKADAGRMKRTGPGPADTGSPAWTELDKLKF